MKNHYQGQLKFLLSESEYIAEQRALTAFDEQISLCSGKLILFGCGNMGLQVLQCLHANGIEPLAAVDSNPLLWGKSLAGLPILSLTEAAEKFGGETGFLVTVYNPNNPFIEISQQIHNAGCQYVFSLVPLRWKFHQIDSRSGGNRR